MLSGLLYSASLMTPPVDTIQGFYQVLAIEDGQQAFQRSFRVPWTGIWDRSTVQECAWHLQARKAVSTSGVFIYPSQFVDVAPLWVFVDRVINQCSFREERLHHADTGDV
jgi:hypothetical protein